VVPCLKNAGDAADGCSASISTGGGKGWEDVIPDDGGDEQRRDFAPRRHLLHEEGRRV
jgi:hypothetical protein